MGSPARTEASACASPSVQKHTAPGSTTCRLDQLLQYPVLYARYDDFKSIAGFRQLAIECIRCDTPL